MDLDLNDQPVNFFNPQARELVLAAREVYNDLKTKRQKDESRFRVDDESSRYFSEEVRCNSPSARFESNSESHLGITFNLNKEFSVDLNENSLGESTEISREIALERKADGEPQCDTGARTSTRADYPFSGISVQQCITSKGIKVTINLQTPEDALTGDIISLTAELKNTYRLREIEIVEYDSAYFSRIFEKTKEEILTFSKQERDTLCIGRLHDRGIRGAWFANMFVVGVLENTIERKLGQIILYCDNYAPISIQLSDPVSPNQQKYYVKTGIFGLLKTGKPAPTWQKASRRSLKDNS